MTGAVHVADALIGEQYGVAELGTFVLDKEYLHAVGVIDEIPKWRRLAAELSVNLPAATLASGIWQIVK